MSSDNLKTKLKAISRYEIECEPVDTGGAFSFERKTDDGKWCKWEDIEALLASVEDSHE